MGAGGAGWSAIAAQGGAGRRVVRWGATRWGLAAGVTETGLRVSRDSYIDVVDGSEGRRVCAWGPSVNHLAEARHGCPGEERSTSSTWNSDWT